MPTTIPANLPAGLSPKQAEANEIDPKIARLRATHPLYAEYAPRWEMYVNAYEGGERFANIKNLFQHQRENAEDFADRGQRVHYFNYCGPLVDFFTNFIFSETITRDGGADNDFYQKFILDVNKKGDSVTDFMREISDENQIYGMVWTEVTTPRKPEGKEVVTKQDEENLNIRPYWVKICPLEMLDWASDEFDKLLYLKRKQMTDGIVNGARIFYEKYTEYYPTKTDITLVDITDPQRPKIASEESIPNPIGEITVHLTRFKRSKLYPFVGESFLIDFAMNNREVMNYTSLLQEFLYRQCFNILAKEVDTSVPMRDQQDGNLGTSNVLEYPKGAAAPAYISPPVAPAKFIQDERQRIVNEMFKRAAQDTVNELFNGEKSSGFSQAQSFSKTVPFIASRADVLEKTENSLMALTMKMMGNKTWEGKVKYKDRYEITNITDAITQLTSVFRDLMLPSETFVKEELKRLVSELDGKITPDNMKKIHAEIDAMDFDEWHEAQKTALIGNAGNSPAEQQADKSTGTMAEVAAESKKAPKPTKKLKK